MSTNLPQYKINPLTKAKLVIYKSKNTKLHKKIKQNHMKYDIKF